MQNFLPLTHMWRFRASHIPLSIRLNRLKFSLINIRPPPWAKVIRNAEAKDRWVIYFAYLPNAHLSAQHLYTLQRLREQSLPVLLVCATSDPAISGLLAKYSDAIILKGLTGYDFSAYSLALNHLAERSPGSDVLVMNDSVYGPFTDLNHAITVAPWDLTGFTSSRFVETEQVKIVVA